MPPSRNLLRTHCFVLLQVIVALSVSLSVAAQTFTSVTTYPNSGLTLEVPCVGKGARGITAGQGETIPFTGQIKSVFHYVIADGKENGYYTYTVNMKGWGAITRRLYTAVGTFQQSFKNFVPKPDGLGEFVYDEHVQITSWKDSVVYHRRVAFVETYNELGQVISTDEPNDVVCQ